MNSTKSTEVSHLWHYIERSRERCEWGWNDAVNRKEQGMLTSSRKEDSTLMAESKWYYRRFLGLLDNLNVNVNRKRALFSVYECALRRRGFELAEMFVLQMCSGGTEHVWENIFPERVNSRILGSFVERLFGLPSNLHVLRAVVIKPNLLQMNAGLQEDGGMGEAG
ncbi:hypothetical protein GWI33_006417 [Rhynchophorus ferrugineus]|uniref:Uncharacterized protein n=1 Tax=Rhynchophorus ferrugineus TaxID=354439 RepID=A0A834IIR4_RHYFE|nr:hypothetical protein GWI33_006417 [Rhynchophorus ferrugineus]